MSLEWLRVFVRKITPRRDLPAPLRKPLMIEYDPVRAAFEAECG